jgi:hypothetical protein
MAYWPHGHNSLFKGAGFESAPPPLSIKKVCKIAMPEPINIFANFSLKGSGSIEKWCLLLVMTNSCKNPIRGSQINTELVTCGSEFIKS